MKGFTFAICCSLLALGVLGQLNEQLNLNPAAAYNPIPAMRIPSSESCGNRAIVEGRLSSTPEQNLSIPYRLYGAGSLKFGAPCTAPASNEAAFMFFNAADATSIPGLQDLVAPLLSGTDEVSLILQYVFTTIPDRAVGWVLIQEDVVCRNGNEPPEFSGGGTPEGSPVSNPVGLAFVPPEDFTVQANGVDYTFAAGRQYFHYLELNIANDGTASSKVLCSYVTRNVPTQPPPVNPTPTATATASETTTATVAPTPTASPMPTPTVEETESETETETETESSSSPTETPTPGDGDDPPCFPGSSTVETRDGSFKRMDQLEIGDIVRVSATEFSEVYFFSHKDESVVADMVTLHAGRGASISMSGIHYVYANGKLTASGDVVVGDEVELADGSKDVVSAVSTQKMSGLYAPHTMQGDIVVDGVKASTFTRAVNPVVANMLLMPIRFMYSLGVNLTFLEKEGTGRWLSVGAARALRLKGPVSP